MTGPDGSDLAADENVRRPNRRQHDKGPNLTRFAAKGRPHNISDAETMAFPLKVLEASWYAGRHASVRLGHADILRHF